MYDIGPYQHSASGPDCIVSRFGISMHELSRRCNFHHACTLRPSQESSESLEFAALYTLYTCTNTAVSTEGMYCDTHV